VSPEPLNESSTRSIRAWWDAGNAPAILPLAMRARFATLLIRCEQSEGRVAELEDGIRLFLATGAPLRGSVGPPATKWLALMENVETLRELLPLGGKDSE